VATGLRPPAGAFGQLEYPTPPLTVLPTVQRRCAKATAQLLRDTGRRRRPKHRKNSKARHDDQ
jgi:hypothetical protein